MFKHIKKLFHLPKKTIKLKIKTPAGEGGFSLGKKSKSASIKTMAGGGEFKF